MISKHIDDIVATPGPLLSVNSMPESCKHNIVDHRIILIANALLIPRPILVLYRCADEKATVIIIGITSSEAEVRALPVVSDTRE